MTEVTLEIPDSLKDEKGALKGEFEEIVQREEKRRLLSSLADEIMKGAGSLLSENELVKLGRTAKRGRFKALKRKGMV